MIETQARDGRRNLKAQGVKECPHFFKETQNRT